MIETHENNWYSWSYDGELFSRRINHDSVFETNFSPIGREIKSFKEECKIAAQSILDTYTDLKPEIFFSGGADSELIVRAFLEIGYKPNIYVVRYENDYNIYDVSYAYAICSSLGLECKVIDFNLKKFYENEAEKVAEEAQVDRPRGLPQCYFYNMVDGLPILAGGDINALRANKDYSSKAQWYVRCNEYEIGWNKYAIYHNRPAIPEFMKWTPEIVYAYSKTKWFIRLVNDYYKGRIDNQSTKLLGFREAWPDMLERKKQTGLESLSELVNEFENFLKEKFNGLPYRGFHNKPVNDFWNQLHKNKIT